MYFFFFTTREHLELEEVRVPLEKQDLRYD